MSEVEHTALDGSCPDWFTPGDCAQWAFTLGQLHLALQRVLDASALRDRLPAGHWSAKSIEDYRSMRNALADVLRWCDERAQEEHDAYSARALALTLGTERIRHLLDNAHRGAGPAAASRRASQPWRCR